MKRFDIPVWLLVVALTGGCASNPSSREDLIAVHREAAAAYQEEEFERAEELYVRLTEAMPEDAMPWFRLGNIHARERRPDRAVEAYRNAIRLDPEMYKAWHNLGIVYLRQATNSFTQMALRAPPGDPMRGRGEEYAHSLFELLGDTDDLPAIENVPADDAGAAGDKTGEQ